MKFLLLPLFFVTSLLGSTSAQAQVSRLCAPGGYIGNIYISPVYSDVETPFSASAIISTQSGRAITSRSGPGTDYVAQYVLQPGTRVTIIRYTYDSSCRPWYKLDFGGYYTWVYGDSVTY